MGAQEGKQRLQIRCLDCTKSETITWLPLLWDAGTCRECAQTSVTNHLLEYPLHRCEVLPGEPLVESKSTRTLTRRNGW
jgi:hypothetical protein